MADFDKPLDTTTRRLRRRRTDPDAFGRFAASTARFMGSPRFILYMTIFVVVYFAVFGVGITYLLRMMRKGPVLDLLHAHEPAEAGGPGHSRTPSRPLSAAGDSVEDEQEQRP